MSQRKLPQIEGLRKYIEKLQLEWPINWTLDTDEINSLLTSSEKNKSHEIIIHSGALRNTEFFLCDLVQALCKCYLGENISTCFCQTHLPIRYWQMRAKEKEEFNQKAQWLVLATSHIDIWANELRHKYWPELSLRDQESFAQSITLMAMHRDVELLRTPHVQLGIAQYQAESKRLGLNSPSLFLLLESTGYEIDPKIKTLSEFYTSLPELSFDSAKDLELLERSAKEVVKILSLPISPFLKKESGMWVWDFEWP